jgi:ABC-type uncharacterized transport system YnjBCD substrate-binding protein
MIKSEMLKGKLSKDAYIAVLEAEIAMNNTVIDNISKLGAMSVAANAAAAAVYAHAVGLIIQKDAQAKNSEEHF